MKKIGTFNLCLLAFVSLFLMAIMFFPDSKTPSIEEYTSNPALETIHPSPDWQGTPKDQNGNFINLYQPFESGFMDLLKWKFSSNPQKQEKKQDQRKLELQFNSDLFQDNKDQIVWLGHASYYIQMAGLRMLVDPIFFDNIFLKRESELPFHLEDIQNIDFVLISHSHRDHCDETTIRYLAEKLPGAVFLVSLGMEEVIKSWIQEQTVQEAGWYQNYNLHTKPLQITYVPSRHWSRRGLWDQNKSLWGGFYFTTEGKTIYFMGDSGYGPHFTDIRKVMGAPDFCIMGVGAYKPEWFMHQSHLNPQDAIKAFHDLEGKHFIPMHFGTFDLSDEPLLDPLDWLESHRNLIKGNWITPVLGKNLLEESTTSLTTKVKQ